MMLMADISITTTPGKAATTQCMVQVNCSQVHMLLPFTGRNIHNTISNIVQYVTLHFFYSSITVTALAAI